MKLTIKLKIYSSTHTISNNLLIDLSWEMDAVRLRKKPLGFSLPSAGTYNWWQMIRPQQQQTSRSHVNLILFGPILRLMRHPLFSSLQVQISKSIEKVASIYSSSLVGANRKQRFVHVSATVTARAPRYFDGYCQRLGGSCLVGPSSHLFFKDSLKQTKHEGVLQLFETMEK
jgi:hypothetical protein